MSAGFDRKRFDRAIEAFLLIPDPLLRAEAIRGARESLESLEADAIRDARGAGITWKAIGSRYGLSKQGAQQRFRNPRDGVAEPGQE